MKTITSGERAIGKVGQRRQVVIPKKIFDSVGLEEGNFVEISQQEGAVLIKPQAVIDVDEALTTEEEKLVERGFEQLKRGEYIIWTQLKHELGL